MHNKKKAKRYNFSLRIGLAPNESILLLFGKLYMVAGIFMNEAVIQQKQKQIFID